jgi:hypothetical protein
LYRKALGHDVSKLARGRDMKNTNLAQSHFLADEVNVNLNVLRSSMVNRISSHVNNTDIVTKDKRSLGERNMKLLKKLAQPATFSNNVGNCPIFCLSTGTGNSSLLLRRPRDQSIAEKDTVARGRAPRIRAANPISIRIRREGVDRTSANPKTKG